MALLTIVKEINSAHGRKIHGHTFRIEIEFEGCIKDDFVDGIDFNAIKIPINEVIDKLDKKYIEDVIDCRGTVENIAVYIIKNLKHLKGLSAITVWEGPDKYVKIFSEEI